MFNFFDAFNWFGKTKVSDVNIMTANDYYDRLKLIALSLFEWEGLPESCNVRFLEETLFLYGRALFVFDDTLGYINPTCTPSGQLNLYNEPVSYHAYGVSGYSKDFKRKDCVLIRNNYLERPTNYTILLFASRLTEAERTIDTNIKAQKTPTLIKCDDKDRKSLKVIYEQYTGNEPVIYGSKSLSDDAVKVLKTDAPFVADKLQNYKHEIWNEALTFLGINNANSDKRERLITNEVDANNEVISINAESMLLTRLEACKWIKERYGLNVTVKMRSFEDETEDEGEGETREGEE